MRGHTVSRTSPQGTNATEGGAEVLLAISRELRESGEEYAAAVAPRPSDSAGNQLSKRAKNWAPINA